MCLTVQPCPWVHGCNRLITCLRWMMSLCWQLISGLWTQTCFSWPRLVLDDPFFTFSTFSGSKTWIQKVFQKWSDYFKTGLAVFPWELFLFSGPSLLALSVCFRFNLLLLLSGLFKLSSQKWIGCPATLTRMDLNKQKKCTEKKSL